MIVLALFACTSMGPTPGPASRASVVDPDSGATGETGTDDRYVFIDTHDVIETRVGYDDIGPTLWTGMDVDHDGVLEWATASPREWDYPKPFVSIVTIFEGTSIIAARARGYDSYNVALLGAFDANHDGFEDLLWRSCPRYRKCQIEVTIGTAVPDLSLQLTAPGDTSSAEPKSVDGHAGSALVAWWLPDAVSYGPLPTKASHEAVPLSWDDVVVDQRPVGETRPTSRTVFSAVRVIPEPDGEPTHFLTATEGAIEQGAIASVRVCPLRAGVDLARDCSRLPADEPLGLRPLAADLDGDGVHELLAGALTRGSDGAVWIFERDGRWRGTLRGTEANPFTGFVSAVVDDAGEPWLLASSWQVIHAFRSRGLRGEVSIEEAERLYAHSEGSQLTRMAPYRETPDGPLLLLVADHLRVFRRPFEP